MSLNVLITSGGTVCKIDDVRHIGNFSGGSTGAAIAEEFLENGHKVHYLYSKNSKRPFYDEFFISPRENLENQIERVSFAYNLLKNKKANLTEYPYLTFEDYRSQVKSILKSKNIQVAILAAAVSDYGVNQVAGKISSSLDEIKIGLVRLPKVISEVKSHNPKVYQVGFKLLSRASPEKLIKTAKENLVADKSDMVVANTLVDGNFAKRKIYIVTKDRVTPTSARFLPQMLYYSIINIIDSTSIP